MNIPGRRSLGAALLAVVLLSGCGADEAEPLAPPPPELRMSFSYPMNGQRAVPPGADVVVTLSQAIDADAAGDYALVDAADQPVAAALSLRGGDESRGHILRFDPQEKLAAGREYRVVSQNSGREWLRFTTASTGPRAASQFAVEGMTADLAGNLWDGRTLPFVEFSTLRLRFNKPVDPGTVVAGETFLMSDPDGNPVAGTLKAAGDGLVFDPAADLTPGVDYTVTLTADVRSADGQNLNQTEFVVQPVSAGQVATQRMQLTPTDSAYDEDAAPVPESDLVGQKLNSMRLSSTLIGANNSLDIGGGLIIDVADPRNFDNLIPFRIRRGSLLEVDALEVLVGGHIPLGLNSGPIMTEFLTDATGFFLENPYDSDGPATAVVFLDLGVSASNPKEQGVLNTEVLQVQGVGTLDIVKGVMYAEVFGAMELPILGGAEYGTAIFDMKLSGPHKGVVRGPEAPAMTIVSTLPAHGERFLNADDSVLVNFSSSIDPGSVVPGGNVRLDPEPAAGFDVDVDGATLLIDSNGGWGYGTSYTLTVGPGIRSVAGSSYETEQKVEWRMPAYTESPSKPQLLALGPGVPCALVDGDPLGPDMEYAGRCKGGLATDDRYPVFKARGAGVVEAYFNQPMDPSTLVLAQGESCDQGSVCIERMLPEGGSEVVAGNLRVTERRLTFVPDRSWEEGAVYRLTLAAEAIKGANGQPLNSTPLAGQDGHDPVVIPFIGSADDGSAYQPLAPWPYSDVNGDFQVGGGEQPYPHASTLIRIVGTGGLVSGATIEDPATDGSEGYMYLNYGLINMIGAYDEERDVVPVRVLPQFLHGTSLSMKVALLGINAASAATHQVLIRPRAEGNGEIYLNEETGESWIRVSLPLYVDAPYLELKILNSPLLGNLLSPLLGLNPRELIQSKEIELDLTGPVTNLPDGRIMLNLTNSNTATLDIDLGSLIGNVELEIPSQGARVNLVGPPLKGLKSMLGAH